MKQEDNTIYVGKKPLSNYLTAVTLQLAVKDKKQVEINARGKYISKAVDVAEVIRNRFVQEAKISKVEIGSEEIPNLKNNNGENVRVSTIKIVLSK